MYVVLIIIWLMYLPGDSKPTKGDIEDKTDAEDRWRIIKAIVGSTIGCIIALVLFILLIWYFHRRYSRLEQEVKHEAVPLRIVQTDDWEIFPSKISIDDIIERGAFGNVFSGRIFRDVCKKLPYFMVNRKKLGGKGKINRVVVKCLKDEAVDTEEKDFLEEIDLMKSIGFHKNIVNLIGASTQMKPLCLVLEYMPYGNLLHYLRKKRIHKTNSTAVTLQPGPSNAESNDLDALLTPSDNVLTADDLLGFQWQIACGMEYLASKHLVHRDLAARNVLVGKDKIVKISDFGLTRKLSADLIYVGKTNRALPIKWMSIEAITNEEFTMYSDVWAYGVVLFEIVTMGGEPYPTINNKDIVSRLKSGYRMKRPNNCSRMIYHMMLRCWRDDPVRRPTFTQLRENLEEIMP